MMLCIYNDVQHHARLFHMRDDPNLLTRVEAADRLGVSLRTLDNWRKAGKLLKDTEVVHPTSWKIIRFRKDLIDMLAGGWTATNSDH